MNQDSPDPDESPLPEIPCWEPPGKIRRRKLLGMMAFSAIAGAFAGAFAGAAAYRPVRDAVDWTELPGKARQAKNRLQDRVASAWSGLGEKFDPPAPTPRTLESEQEYAAFLSRIPLRYLTPAEVIRPHRNIRNGVPNELPPRAYWNRIEKTLLVADEIRHRLGKPLYCINSAYRSPAYNAACPGTATWSYHMKNQALDLMFTGGSAAASEVAGKLREEEFFAGGIGTYPNFIHIDTRGSNATWEA